MGSVPDPNRDTTEPTSLSLVSIFEREHGDPDDVRGIDELMHEISREDPAYVAAMANFANRLSRREGEDDETYFQRKTAAITGAIVGHYFRSLGEQAASFYASMGISLSPPEDSSNS